MRSTDTNFSHLFSLNARAGVSVAASHELVRRLLFHFLTDARFDALVLLLGNLFAHLPVSRIATQYVGVETGGNDKRDGHNFARQILVTPRHGTHHYVKQKSPYGIEQETKVEGNNDADKFELRFQAANEEAAAGGVNGQHKTAKGTECGHYDDLCRCEIEREKEKICWSIIDKSHDSARCTNPE